MLKLPTYAHFPTYFCHSSFLFFFHSSFFKFFFLSFFFLPSSHLGNFLFLFLFFFFLLHRFAFLSLCIVSMLWLIFNFLGLCLILNFLGVFVLWVCCVFYKYKFSGCVCIVSMLYLILNFLGLCLILNFFLFWILNFLGKKETQKFFKKKKIKPIAAF